MSAISKDSLTFTALSVAAVALINVAGCALETANEPAGVGGSAGIGGVMGGSSGMGGATSTGGASNTGGTVMSAGGSSGSGTGGSSAGTGGSAAGVGASGGVGGGATGGGSGAGTGGTGMGGAGAGGSATGGAGTGPGGGGGSGGSGPFTCTLPDLPDASALPELGMKLPDPFKFFDGRPVTTKEQWECRRKEILAMAAKYLYGPVPGDCDEVTGTVSGSMVSITCKVGTNSQNFSATISGSGKSINVQLGSGILPQGKSLSLGSGNDAKIRNLYGLSELNPNIANAWMINRVMDVLEKNPGTHDPKTIAVSGCSGCGKGAFLAGVFSRAPIVVIVESGGGGGSSWRMNEWFAHGEGKSIWDCSDRPQGIDVLEETGICGPWVTSAAQSFRSKPATVNNMPFDQHLLLATIAPRYLVHFTNNNGAGSWCWLGGTSEALASWAAHSVYKALGVEKNHSMEVYNGGHCGVGDTGIAAAMFKRALDGDMAADTGKINIQDSRVQLPVAEWKELFVDWNMDTVLQ